MDWEVLWSFLNSPIGLTLAGAGLLFLLNYVYSKKPGWMKFEGAIISGIKLAEKAVPDGTDNAGMAKLDAALKYVLQIHEAKTKRAATAKEIADLQEGIQIKHVDLIAKGAL